MLDAATRATALEALRWMKEDSRAIRAQVTAEKHTEIMANIDAALAALTRGGEWQPLPDGYTRDNPNWALENIRLCRYVPQGAQAQEDNDAE